MNSAGLRTLHVDGGVIVDQEGRRVTLQGVALGGWMMMENFITGHPATEQSFRRELDRRLGPALAAEFFDHFLEDFFGEADASLLASAGLNCVRLPVNYRHLEDDGHPFVVRDEGFHHLDRVVDLCARHGLYTVIDLHALPGYQNSNWHSDNPTHVATLWDHLHFQDRSVRLWEAIAEHYRGRPGVAGFNLINEPAVADTERLIRLYQRLRDAVLGVDSTRMLFVDGNRFALDFTGFPAPWPNTVYSAHDYAVAGMGNAYAYPGVVDGVFQDRGTLERRVDELTRYMTSHDAAIWIGEFGPIYTGDPRRDEARVSVLRDQLAIYAERRLNWSLWTYKDIGAQGIVTARPDSPWLERTRPLLELKRQVGADEWGTDGLAAADIMATVYGVIAAVAPEYRPYPFDAQWMLRRLVQNIGFAEALVEPFGELFDGLDSRALAALASSFRLEQCDLREDVLDALQAATDDKS